MNKMQQFAFDNAFWEPVKPDRRYTRLHDCGDFKIQFSLQVVVNPDVDPPIPTWLLSGSVIKNEALLTTRDWRRFHKRAFQVQIEKARKGIGDPENMQPRANLHIMNFFIPFTEEEFDIFSATEDYRTKCP